MIYPDGGLYEGYFKADKFDGMVSVSRSSSHAASNCVVVWIHWP